MPRYTPSSMETIVLLGSTSFQDLSLVVNKELETVWPLLLLKIIPGHLKCMW